MIFLHLEKNNISTYVVAWHLDVCLLTSFIIRLVSSIIVFFGNELQIATRVQNIHSIMENTFNL